MCLSRSSNIVGNPITSGAVFRGDIFKFGAITFGIGWGVNLRSLVYTPKTLLKKFMFFYQIWIFLEGFDFGQISDILLILVTNVHI